MGASRFAALAIVALGVRKLFDGAPCVSAVHRRAHLLSPALFAVCLGLVLWFGSGVGGSAAAWFGEAERWRYFTGIVVVEYLADEAAAWLAARHAMRLWEHREEEAEPDADG